MVGGQEEATGRKIAIKGAPVLSLSIFPVHLHASFSFAPFPISEHLEQPN